MNDKAVTSEQHRAIAQEIRRAEEKTSGEIYCVVAQASDDYFYPAAFMALIAMLAVGLAAALALEAGWYSMRLPFFVGAQMLAVASVLLVLAFVPWLRVRLVPRRLQFRRAHDNAMKQFLARNVHITAERTGVLIFVSLAERYAEVVADSGIDSKVDQSDWNDIVRDLVDHAGRDKVAEGFVSAIRRVGALLAAHFPPRPDNPNELDDHLVEI